MWLTTVFWAKFELSTVHRYHLTMGKLFGIVENPWLMSCITRQSIMWKKNTSWGLKVQIRVAWKKADQLKTNKVSFPAIVEHRFGIPVP